MNNLSSISIFNHEMKKVFLCNLLDVDVDDVRIWARRSGKIIEVFHS